MLPVKLPLFALATLKQRSLLYRRPPYLSIAFFKSFYFFTMQAIPGNKADTEPLTGNQPMPPTPPFQRHELRCKTGRSSPPVPVRQSRPGVLPCPCLPVRCASVPGCSSTDTTPERSLRSPNQTSKVPSEAKIGSYQGYTNGEVVSGTSLISPFIIVPEGGTEKDQSHYGGVTQCSR